MSEAARVALINVGTRRQGATVNPSTPAPVVTELQRLGLIGEGRGLTARGHLVRDEVVQAEMDKLFR